jgi:hypothetical protein
LRRQRAGLAAGLLLETDLHGPSYFYLGLYEYEIAHHVAAMAQPSCTSFDVGAGWGYYSLILSKITAGRVVAFETDERSLERLEYHLRVNRPTAARVMVRRAFVGARSRPEVNEVALDDVAGTNGIPLPDLIKIDIEGSEADALRGAQKLLRESRPHIIVETHSSELERQCGDFLVGLGYRPTVVKRRTRFREDRPSADNRWLVARGERPYGDR